MYKPIGLLTVDSHNSNYGVLLQAYALQQVIQSFGYTCEIIDYIHSKERAIFSIKKERYAKPSIGFLLMRAKKY